MVHKVFWKIDNLRRSTLQFQSTTFIADGNALSCTTFRLVIYIMSLYNNILYMYVLCTHFFYGLNSINAQLVYALLFDSQRHKISDLRYQNNLISRDSCTFINFKRYSFFFLLKFSRLGTRHG